MLDLICEKKREMPCRNVIPKSIEKPHPRMWFA
jgi:hypothetical protein